jgi:hypothetical protein
MLLMPDDDAGLDGPHADLDGSRLIMPDGQQHDQAALKEQQPDKGGS